MAPAAAARHTVAVEQAFDVGAHKLAVLPGRLAEKAAQSRGWFNYDYHWTVMLPLDVAP